MINIQDITNQYTMISVDNIGIYIHTDGSKEEQKEWERLSPCPH